MLPERIPSSDRDLTGRSLCDEGSYWSNRSQECLNALKLAPTDRDLLASFEHAEKMRKKDYERGRLKWQREQEREEADRWLEEMAGAPGFELY